MMSEMHELKRFSTDEAAFFRNVQTSLKYRKTKIYRMLYTLNVSHLRRWSGEKKKRESETFISSGVSSSIHSSVFSQSKIPKLLSPRKNILSKRKEYKTARQGKQTPHHSPTSRRIVRAVRSVHVLVVCGCRIVVR